MERDPRKSGVACFVLAGDRIWFLRPRGWTGNVDVGVPGQILSGELRRSPGGGIQLVDSKSGAVVREGLRGL